MKRVIGLFVLVGAVAGGGLVAVAQEPPQMPPPGSGPGGQGGNFRMQMPNFADLDKNKDKKISKEELPMPPQVFERLDENKDGFIDEEEFTRSRGRMGGGGGGGGPRITETLSKYMDANQDTKVSREEFARINQVFDALDKDHNEVLTPEELNRFFEILREVQNQATGGVDVQGLFDKNDKNKDGKITAEEMASDRHFKALDLNNDGSLTRQEAEEGLKRLELARQKKQASSPAPNK